MNFSKELSEFKKEFTFDFLSNYIKQNMKLPGSKILKKLKQNSARF